MKVRGTATLQCHECGHEWSKTGAMERDATDGVDHIYEDLFWVDGDRRCPRCKEKHWGFTSFTPEEAA